MVVINSFYFFCLKTTKSNTFNYIIKKPYKFLIQDFIPSSPTNFRTLKSYCELSHGGEVRAARQCSADRASGCTTTPS